MASGVRPQVTFIPAHGLCAGARSKCLLGANTWWRLGYMTHPILSTQRARGLYVVSSFETKGSSLFDRAAERDALETYLARSPTTILVVLGPRSSGKTALLQDVLCNDNAKRAFPASYLDARGAQLTDAAVLINLLQRSGEMALQKLSEFLEGFAESRLGKAFSAWSAQEKFDGDSISVSGDKIVTAFLQKQNQTMNDVIEVYGEIFKLYDSSKAPVSSSSSSSTTSNFPIICIDEANVLTEWQKGSLDKKEALGALLRFFIKASKQEQLAYIIFASSDYAFVNWLADEIGYGFFQVEVIGDFPKREAQDFFANVALPRTGRRDIEVSSQAWEAVYEVCGGNAGQLLIAASAYNGDWEKALEVVWNPLLQKVRSGLDSSKRWTKEEYSFVVRLLLAADHAAVPESAVQRGLGDEAGEL